MDDDAITELAPRPDASTEADGVSRQGDDGLRTGLFRLPECWLAMADRLLPLVVHENLPPGIPPETVFEIRKGQWAADVMGASLKEGIGADTFPVIRPVGGNIKPAVRRFVAMAANLPDAKYNDVEDLTLAVLLRTLDRLKDDGHPMPTWEIPPRPARP